MDNDRISFKKNSHVQSVEKALMIMDMLANSKNEISLTEISKKLGWPKSTIHGLISTLRDFGYVDQSSLTGYYKLGIRLFELGNLVAKNWDVREIARPYMYKINHILGETVQLATEDNGEVLYLDKLESNQILRIVSEIGARLPIHCSGLGKVLLAYMPLKDAKRIISSKGMKAMTNRTITNWDDLEKELIKIKKNGYAIDDREIMDSLKCVAVPIFNSENVVKFSISVSGINTSITGEHLKHAIELLVESAKDISRSLGYIV
ncbi:MAG: IclR family transcriptional regulator [Oscillospiraceae bacterium]|nr:IclR family transcriptional regulator [Oscillospiraceae bacterium]